MFDFLFKRRRAAGTAASNTSPVTAAPGNRADTGAGAGFATAARAQARQQQRDQALQAAGQLADEQAALAFVLQCEFADARLAAAQWLTGEAALGSALAAVRNSDRRVAKLLQGRLDALHRYARARSQMAAAVEQVEALLPDAGLTPGHAAAVDRAWTAAGGDMPPDAGHEQNDEIAILRKRFDTARMALSARLAQQTLLQRELVDMRIFLQKTLDGFAAGTAAGITTGIATDIAAGAVAPALDGMAEMTRLGERLAQHRADPEAPTLPPQLLPECERLLAACATAFLRLAEHRESLQKAAAAVANDTAAGIADAEESPDAAAADTALADATAAPAVAETVGADAGAAIGKRPERAARARAPQLPEAERLEQLAHWRTLLAQLETALEAGMLQAASEAERGLRGYDARAIKPAAAETSRLNAAYAGLHHLQGWARWGGNVSREELLQTALALPEQALAVPELAQKIGSLRERWKLVSVSGAAPQALWERFDEACTLAYAPVALQYRQQEQVRQENRAAAELLLSEILQYVEKMRATAIPQPAPGTGDDASAAAAAAAISPVADDEFKAIAKFASRMRQSWQRLGALGHKEKRLLDRAFADALKTLEAPLRHQQKQEIGARQAMIAEVAALQPDDRNTVDTLRQIQAQWQQHAQSVPLARKDEQALWLAFRTACDAVFAQRKQAAGEQDAQRQAHLQEKEALCAELETIAADCLAGAEIDGCAAAVRESLRTIKSAWSRIGQVPRAAERGIEQRFARATDGLQALLQEAQARAAAAAGAAEALLIEQRLALCFAIENSVAERGAAAQDAQDWRARWQAGDAAPRAYEQVLARRFETVINAVDAHSAGKQNANGGDDYLQHLLQQRATFDDALLASEIVAGLDSPPQLARQRMQLQVALLQASLKAGTASEPSGAQAQLLRLCAVPAVADAELRARVSKVVLHAVQA